ncbi:MAG: nickel pincer cofactor biosynthesis protein LarC [Lentisphaeria bacterium]|nr:nickel pincer cofactor biosynthesis protein LarC [Lentisphaeria bacterium]
MGKCLYLEGASGISGDMTVASLLDLGGNQEKLAKVLQSLPMHHEFHYHTARAKSYGIEGCAFNVHCHDHHHDHHHEHDHDHPHDHDHHHHEHRNLSDVIEIIRKADMTDRAAALAEKIFYIVARAEAKAHGCGISEVHFHEVGAVDSIVDIVAAAVLIDDLDITDCVVQSLAEGSGYVTCQHGKLPVPVPAVLNIAEMHGITLKTTSANGEMVTPTGIAIAAALRTSEVLPAEYKIEKVGIGVGKRDFGHANILRAMLIKPTDQPRNSEVLVMECNIDDCSGEMLGLALEKLLQAGALDVHYTPCFMKKNRPGYQMQVIAPAELAEKLEYLIFENTTTIGIRRYPVQRSCMQRQNIKVTTPFGQVDAKKCCWQDIVRIYPEFESVKEIAGKNGAAFKTVFDAVVKAALEL